MKNMMNALFGNFSIRKKTDYIWLPLKVIYLLFSMPMLIFAFCLMARSFGAVGSPNGEKIGIVKKILLHGANIFWSTILWGTLVNVLLGNYKGLN